jgi:hypothetical protein
MPIVLVKGELQFQLQKRHPEANGAYDEFSGEGGVDLGLGLHFISLYD